MSKWQWYSLAVLIGCALTLGAWDAVALSVAGRKASLSYLITWANYHAPIVAFLFGALMGHLFWPLTSYQEDVTEQVVMKITVDQQGNTLKVQREPLERND